MKAAITDGKGNIELRQVDMPGLDEYDCLVKIEACAFCNGTDRHVVEGTFPPGPLKYPSILGHESVGVVQKIGKKVRNLGERDRVLRPYALFPGDRLSGYASAWGGFAEFGKVKDYRAMIDDGVLDNDDVPAFYKYQQKVPLEIDLESSLLLITIKEILSSIAKFEKIEGEHFLIAGAGITACLFGALLKLKGAARVTATARRREPLDFIMARRAADSVCLLSDVSGLGADYDALVETTGSLEAASRLSAKVVAGGWIYSYAIYQGMLDTAFFDPLKINHKFRRVDPDEASAHDEACRLIVEGKLDSTPYVTHRFDANDLLKAWETVIDKKTLKTMLYF